MSKTTAQKGTRMAFKAPSPSTHPHTTPTHDAGPPIREAIRANRARYVARAGLYSALADVVADTDPTAAAQYRRVARVNRERAGRIHVSTPRPTDR